MRMGMTTMAMGSAQGGVVDPPAPSKLDQYSSRVTVDGGIILDIAKCGELIRFLNGESVSVDGTAFVLPESVWDKACTIIDSSSGVKYNASVPGNIAKCYNLKSLSGYANDYESLVETEQPTISNGVLNFNQKRLTAQTGQLIILRKAKSASIIIAKQYALASGLSSLMFSVNAAPAIFWAATNPTSPFYVRAAGRRDSNEAFRTAIGSATDVSTKSVFAMRVDYSTATGAGSAWINNTASINGGSMGFTNNGIFEAPDVAATQIEIGRAAPVSWEMSSLIVFNVPMSDSEIQAINAYLMATQLRAR